MSLSTDTKKRVLIIDDNVDVADSLALWLKMAGHEISVAHSAARALECVPSFLPEVILLDINLPDLNGFSLAKELREIPNVPPFVLAVVTGYGFGTEMSDAQLKDLSIDHYFIKPIGAQKLNSLGISV